MSRSRAWGARKPRIHHQGAPAAPEAPPRRPRVTTVPHAVEEQVRATPRNRSTIVMLAAGVTGGLLLLTGTVMWLVRGGAASVPEDPGPPAVAPAAAYRAVYRVDDTAGPQHLVQTDVVEVQRPDRLRVEHRDGPPPGGAVRSGSIVDRSREVTLPEGLVGFATPLTVALDTDLVDAPALRAAADAGRAQQHEQAVVHGERCTVYVYRHSGTEALAAADGADHVESCVTADGVLARQVITVAGRRARVAELTAVDRSPHFRFDEFATPGDVSPAASATERVIEGRPQEKVVHGLAPAGFRLDRELTDTRQEGDAPLLPYFVQSYAGGGEFVVVQQLMLRENAYPPWSASGATREDLGEGRSADEVYHTGYVEEQMMLDGYPVRVLASRPELARYAAATVRAPS
ncbi:MAG TPA: hypothetical protein VMU20_04760 [Candidatus Dormibacteraeota bacterium]|nr:hypothetical protein [Candidatus Dormibacteraeota bacterium]